MASMASTTSTVSNGETKLSCLNTVKEITKQGSRDFSVPKWVIAGFTGDRSGSMETIDKTCGTGLFDWLSDIADSANLHSQEGTVFVTTFDDESEKVIEGESLNDIYNKIINKEITNETCQDWMCARGMTKLYDTAIADLNNIIAARDAIYDSLPREVQALEPEISMVWACCTDGHDNKSVSTRRDFREKVLWARSKGVKCFFLGANQDAVDAGNQYGFDVEKSMTYGADEQHMACAMRSVTQVMRQASLGQNSTFTQMMRQVSGPASYNQSQWSDDDADDIDFTALNNMGFGGTPSMILRQAACNPVYEDVNEEDDADDAGYEEEDDGLDMPNSSQQSICSQISGAAMAAIKAAF